MAEVTVNSPGQSPALTKPYKGKHHRVYDLTIANTNTFTSGINGITSVAWEPDAAGDACSVVITTVATGVLTFASAGTENGKLHVWSRR